MTYDNLEALQGLRPAARYVQLGTLILDLATHAVRREEGVVRLTPKSAEVLKVLLRHEGEPVSREVLIDQIWRDQYPSDDVVTKAIGELRRVLAQDGQTVIETIPRVGYRLLPTVQWLDADSGAPWEAEPASAEESGEAPVPAANEAPPSWRAAPWWLAAAVIVVAAIGLWLLRPLAPADRSETSGLAMASVQDQERLALAIAGHLSVSARPFAAGAQSEYLPSVSPDGQWVVFVEWPAARGEGSRLMIRALGAESARPLVDDRRVRTETTPNWSPDGQALVYQRIDDDGCQLRWIAPFTGEQRMVAPCSAGFIDWIDFTPDGRGLLLSRPASAGAAPQLRILDLDDGRWRPFEYTRSATDTDVQGVYSPDGQTLVFRRGAAPLSDLYLVAADGGEVRRLTELRTTIRGMDWLPDNRHLLFASSHGGQMALWLLDTQGGQLSPLGAYGAGFPQVAASTGSLVFQQQLQPYNLIRFTTTTVAEPSVQAVFPSSRGDAFPSLSPDGTRMAFVSNRSGRNEILLGDLADGQVATLTRNFDGDVGAPSWSPDGRRLLFERRPPGGGELVEMDIASRRQQALPLDVVDPRNGRYAPDGQSLFFDAEVEGLRQVFQYRPDSEAPLQLTREGGWRPLPSPDGRYLYLLSGDYQLQRLELASGRQQALGSSVGFASQFAWEVDAEGLHVLRAGAANGEGWALYHWTLDAEAGSAPTSTPVQIEGELMGTLLGLSIAPDGSYYTTAELNTDVDVMYVEGLDRLLRVEAPEP
ncbi:MAG: PD40 domain-containing protein [Xanthomonadales bacterium]|nr:PD40 domain-containing protein [Xanthomonadales bacterium]